jgi:hypothetical protein
MTQRDKFEEWYEFDFLPSMSTEYSDRDKNLLWLGWIASAVQMDSEQMATAHIDLVKFV